MREAWLGVLFHGGLKLERPIPGTLEVMRGQHVARTAREKAVFGEDCYGIEEEDGD
jgi:hypothetical protein